MLYKNPEENEQRKYRHYNMSLSAVDTSEIDQHDIRHYYQSINEAEWQKEFIPKVKDALKTLTSRQAQVIELCIIRNVAQSEAAQIMNCSQQAVSRLYFRAIRKMRKFINK